VGGKKWESVEEVKGHTKWGKGVKNRARLRSVNIQWERKKVGTHTLRK